MTKKSKQDSLSMLNRHQSQRVQRGQQTGQRVFSSLKKYSNNKKSIKKAQQPQQLIDKVQLLKQKSNRLYKHAEKKIDRMIEIIQQIQEKKLSQYLSQSNCQHSKPNHFSQQVQKHENSEIKQQTPNDNSQKLVCQEQLETINKTLTHLHNLLTYQKPLSHIKHQFESFYSRLSSFSKQLQSQKYLPDDKKFLIPSNGMKFQKVRLVQKLIKEHYLREGQFKVANLFDRYNEIQTFSNQNQEKINKDKEISKNIENNSKNGSITQQKKVENMKLNKSSQKKSHNKKSSKTNRYDIQPLNFKTPKAQLIDPEQNFKQCYTLKHQILNRDFSEAINWCVQERLYQTYSNSLQYDLRLSQIKLLIHEKKYNKVLDIVRRNFGKFLNQYGQQIQLLVGFLLFSSQWNPDKILDQKDQANNQLSRNCEQQVNKIQQNDQIQENLKKNGHIRITQQLQKSKQQDLILSGLNFSQRYKRFHISTLSLVELAESFTTTYFIHNNISKFDSLKICYEVGQKYQQKYFNSIKMFSQKDREEFIKHRNTCQFNQKVNNQNLISDGFNISGNHSVPHPILLPFQIPVDKKYMYHSIFVCPVTKEVLSSNDGVEYLSCGHLVSQSAKKNMTEVRRSNHKHKCPVCQKDRGTDVIKVRF